MQIEKYKRMIEAFLRNEISAQEFEAQYIDTFLAESRDMNDSLFQILDTLFWAVDSYSPDCIPGQETAFIISEKRLREEAREALARLVAFGNASTGTKQRDQ
jgi:hypothetical protein